jgi:exopolyphosphatase/guanosine-5'-triphosphate,3'-diphosphate pyrophosphatase
VCRIVEQTEVMERLAAIDVGSNAVRMIIGEVTREGQILILKSLRAPIRLGEDVFQHRAVSEKTARKFVKTFEKFGKILKRYKVDISLAVATSAMREASNAPKIISMVQKQTGIHLCVVDGLEEARLINLAVSRVLNIGDQLAALIDIGGGSLELSFLDHGHLIASNTFPMGAVRLMAEANTQNHQTTIDSLLPLIRSKEKKLVEFTRAHLGSRKTQIAAGTGGNIEALGKLRVGLLGRTSSSFLLLEDLETMIRLLGSMSYQARVEQLGLRPDRADVILPAAMTLRSIMKTIGVNDLLVPGVGLKDGILLELKDHIDQGVEANACHCSKNVAKTRPAEVP